MFGALIRHDLRVLVRERSALLVAVLSVAAVVYAVWSGSSWKAVQLAEFDAARAAYNDQVATESVSLQALGRGELTIAEAPSAGLPNTVQVELLQPPGPLAELAIGEADLRPTRATITAMGRAQDMFRFYEVDNPALIALGRFDLAFVIVYLVPLLILGMSYNVLSADRESGALGLLLSQPLTAAQVAWARIGVRSALVVSVVIASMLVAWLVLAPGPIDPQALPRLGLWVLVVLAYCTFWACAAACVVARNGSSDSNALTLLLVWAALTMLLPAAISLVAQSVSPTPSRLEYITTARAAENSANAAGGELMQGYLLDHPEIEATREDAVAPFVQTFVLVQQRVEAAVQPVSERFDERLDRQQRISRALAWISPASLTQAALAELAGTSLTRHRRFEADARQLRRDWLSAVESPLMAGRRLSADEFTALPRPEFREVAMGRVAGSVAPTVPVLLVFAWLALALAHAAFRRFKAGSASG